MAAETNLFGLSDVIGIGQVSAANGNRDGSGTIVTIYTGSGGNKARIYWVLATATVTTTLGMVRIFLTLDGGSTKRLVAEIKISAITVGAGVKAFTDKAFFEDGLPIPDASAILYASTHNAEAINVVARGVNF